jgi:hypothetical protein
MFGFGIHACLCNKCSFRGQAPVLNAEMTYLKLVLRVLLVGRGRVLDAVAARRGVFLSARLALWVGGLAALVLGGHVFSIGETFVEYEFWMGLLSRIVLKIEIGEVLGSRKE